MKNPRVTISHVNSVASVFFIRLCGDCNLELCASGVIAILEFVHYSKGIRWAGEGWRGLELAHPLGTPAATST